MTALLETIGLSRDFVVGRSLTGEKRVLRAVIGANLAVEKGDVLGIVGESGSGKSTLGRMLLGLLEPSAGRIFICGADVSATDRRTLAQRIQPVFQDPYSSLNPRRTVASIVAMPLAVLGIGTRGQRRATALAMLDRVGLSACYGDAFPGELSGGQSQRVAIARALVVGPEIVMLDEPTSALDVSVQSQILNLLLDVQRDFGLTYVFISHNLAVIEYIANRVAVMYLGRIVEAGPRESIFRTPRHPYTRALLSSVLTPEPGLGIPDTGLGLALPNPLHPPCGCHFHPRCPEAGPRCRVSPPRAIPVGETMVACHLHDGGTKMEHDQRNSPGKPPALPEQIEAVLQLREEGHEVIRSPWGNREGPQGDRNVTGS
jgi:peptide/nickel transport system ATP-binding protein